MDEVGRQVRAASAELPVPELHAASLRLGEASQHLGQVLNAGASSPAVPTLRAAGEHLDLATGLLLRAQDALAEYLQMIGLPPGERRTGPAPHVHRRDQVARAGGRARPGGPPGMPGGPPEKKGQKEDDEPGELDEEAVGAGALLGDDAFDDSVDTDYRPDSARPDSARPGDDGARAGDGLRAGTG